MHWQHGPSLEQPQRKLQVQHNILVVPSSRGQQSQMICS
jgi:hypothetical protein